MSWVYQHKEEENVVTVIWYLHDMDIWKIIILWNQSRLGNIEAFGNGCIVAPGADRDGYWWIDIHSISDIDSNGNCCIDLVKGINSLF